MNALINRTVLCLSIGAAAALLIMPDSAQAAQGFFQIPDSPKNIGLDDIVSILVRIVQFALLFAAGVSVIFVVVNGYQYIFSAGNPEKVEKAKQGLTWSIVGFILTVSSYAIVLLLQRVLKAQHLISEAPGLNNALRGAPRDARSIIPAIADALLVFGAAAATLFIIINGYRYATSQGNQDQIDAAKRGLLYSVIGLAVLFLSYTIVVTATQALQR